MCIEILRFLPGFHIGNKHSDGMQEAKHHMFIEILRFLPCWTQTLGTQSSTLKLYKLRGLGWANCPRLI